MLLTALRYALGQVFVADIAAFLLCFLKFSSSRLTISLRTYLDRQQRPTKSTGFHCFARTYTYWEEILLCLPRVQLWEPHRFHHVIEVRTPHIHHVIEDEFHSHVKKEKKENIIIKKRSFPPHILKSNKSFFWHHSHITHRHNKTFNFMRWHHH